LTSTTAEVNCSSELHLEASSSHRTTSSRTCARLCRAAGGGLEQIQMLLGHASLQTTERYLGSRQEIASAVNDHLGIPLGARRRRRPRTDGRSTTAGGEDGEG